MNNNAHIAFCVCVRVCAAEGTDQVLHKTLRAALADQLKPKGHGKQKESSFHDQKRFKYYFTLVVTLENDIYILFVVSANKIAL